MFVFFGHEVQNVRTKRFGALVVAACGDFQTSRKMFLCFDNMKYAKEEGKKEVNAAYIRLMRYFTNIYIDITTFLEKLFTYSLYFLSIAQNTSSVISFCFVPNLVGIFFVVFFFLRDCFESANTNTDRSM